MVGRSGQEDIVTVGETVNWCSHHGKKYGGFLKKLKIQLPYNTAIALLGIYPKKTKTLILKDICIPLFIAALFTVWKQPKCPSIDDWIKKM